VVLNPLGSERLFGIFLSLGGRAFQYIKMQNVKSPITNYPNKTWFDYCLIGDWLLFGYWNLVIGD
jgi:hypothetical protein